jgi:aminopeptidase YwaD
MFKHILQTLGPRVSGANTLDLIAHIQDLDRWSSFDRHREASRYCHQRMQEYGLHAELFPIAADGATIHGDFVMPRAWDATEATLTVLGRGSRGEVTLCRYTHEPCSLVVHSKATPPGGVTAEVVVMDGGSRAEDYRAVDVRDKIIFTRESPRAVKLEAVQQGALGVISDEMPEIGTRPPLSLPDGLAWTRFMSDHDHGGWGMRQGDTECWGFMLTPRQGEWLRALIAREGAVQMHAEVDAGLYDGTLEVVTGWIPGETDEQVIMNGHLHEFGAIDNASGAGVAIEVLRVLRELIAAGKLARPKRGIRLVFTYECMGTMAVVATRPDVIGPRTVAGLTLDCVGGRESLSGAPLDIWRNPEAAASYTDVLLAGIMRHLSETDPLLVNWRQRGFGAADNLIADPSIGVPCPALIECPYTHYHCSTDTPDKLDPAKLAWVGRAAATYAYFLAQAGEPEARWLAQQVQREAQHTMSDEAGKFVSSALAGGETKPTRAADLWRRLDYQRVRYDLALDSVRRLAGDEAEELAGQLVVQKGHLGELAHTLFRQATATLGMPARRPAAPRGEYHEAVSRLVPRRLVLGPWQGSRVPLDERPQWREANREAGVTGQVATDAEMWADGQRSIAEIEALVAAGTGGQPVRLLDFFERYAKCGYVQLRQI